MCLAVPMTIKTIDGFACTCEARGIEREVSLFMMQGEELTPGDNVLVHVGYAIQKVSAEEAEETWALFDEMLAAEVPGLLPTGPWQRAKAARHHLGSLRRHDVQAIDGRCSYSFRRYAVAFGDPGERPDGRGKALPHPR